MDILWLAHLAEDEPKRCEVKKYILISVLSFLNALVICKDIKY